MQQPISFMVETEIEWADLDLFGHVNNVAFFYYVQKARLQFCEQLGLSSLNEANKLGFIVASSHCDFKLPLFYPGKITVNVQVTYIHNTSFCLSYQLFNQQQQISAVASDVLVLFDYGLRKKTTITSELKSRMMLFLSQEA